MFHLPKFSRVVLLQVNLEKGYRRLSSNLAKANKDRVDKNATDMANHYITLFR